MSGYTPVTFFYVFYSLLKIVQNEQKIQLFKNTSFYSQEQVNFLEYFNHIFLERDYKLSNFDQEYIISNILRDPDLLNGLEHLQTKGILYPNGKTGVFLLKDSGEKHLLMDVCNLYALLTGNTHQVTVSSTINFDAAA